jgi:hypothetical protein
VGRGKPKKKEVYLEYSHSKIYWAEVGDQHDPSVDKSLALGEITDLFVGKHTAAFEKKSGKKADEECCLSIGASRGTLDLEAESKEVRDTWVAALQVLAEQPIRVHGSQSALDTIAPLATSASSNTSRRSKPRADGQTSALICIMCRDLIRMNPNRATVYTLFTPMRH